MNAAIAIAKHLKVNHWQVTRVEEWAKVFFAVVKGLGARFVSKKVAKMELTEKQRAAWEKRRAYVGHGYRVEFCGKRVKGFFNSSCGEYVSKFDFEYNPNQPDIRDPNWKLSTYTLYKEKAAQHGWLTVGCGDDWSDIPLPQFAHPDELYQELREQFGYKRTLIKQGY